MTNLGAPKRVLKALLPKWAKNALASITRLPSVRRVRYWGLRYYCPVCRSSLRSFINFGRVAVVKNAECPVCGSHRRHRLIWLYFDHRPNLLPGRRLLDVAPLPCLSRRWAATPGIDYLSADRDSPRAMVKMDLTSIQYPDDSFDAIYCSHVLEHIPDDAAAMRELFRVLRPAGWAILQVPIDRSRRTTFEDWTIQSFEDREKAFGQWDHVRVYGRDYRLRLESAGFDVAVDPFVKGLPAHVVERFGLNADEDIYLCSKKGACRIVSR